MLEHMTPGRDLPQDASDALIGGIIAQANEEHQRRTQAIEEARLAQPDKEPFDINALAPFYKLDVDAEGNVVVDATTVQDLQYAYYVGNPGLQSLEAFGQRMTWLDQNEAN